MANTEYITKPGDRWDLIAYKSYGALTVKDENGNDESAIGKIIRANPALAITSELTEGLLLQIPIIVNSVQTTDASLLPPWKRV